MKICFLTLGCKVNQTESEALAQLAVTEGYRVVKESEEPDVVVINTCTVTGTGSGKSRKLIRRIAKDHPSSMVAVMGCYSQTNPGEVAGLAGVDLVIGTQDRRFIIEYLKQAEEKGIKKMTALSGVKSFELETDYEELPLIENESRARAMLKIQDGCSQFCTYCIVPYARGPSRSRKPENVIAEAKQLLKSGYKEIVLTGVHIGAYGKDINEDIDLAGLVSKLVKLKGMTRLRLGSIEPMEFTRELLEIATDHQAVCHHFHIPLQSGSNAILVKMKRPYTTEEYTLLLRKIRDRIPDAAIAADIMTGFPGETEKEHLDALRFIESCDFAGIHAFPYSRRPGTAAAKMPDQVVNSVKAARVRDIMMIGERSRKRYSQRFIGKTIEVLLERVGPDGTAKGHTRNYLELRLPSYLNTGKWQAGQLINCIFREEYLLP